MLHESTCSMNRSPTFPRPRLMLAYGLLRHFTTEGTEGTEDTEGKSSCSMNQSPNEFSRPR
jgi:hypothetical protein